MADGGQKRGGGVSAFAIEQPSGKLRLINQVSAVGQGPCHVGLDAAGTMAMIANYGSGSVASYAINADGSLSEHRSFYQHEGSGADPRRQKGPHAHSFNRSPDNRFGFACDLGLDQVLIYALNPRDGSMKPHGLARVPAGGGPRHFAFHPGGRHAFVNNEMGMSLSCFAYDAQKGELKLLATESTLPPEDRSLKGLSTAEVVAHPNGRTVYVSNRTHDSIAVFSFNESSGALTLLETVPAEGRIPRNFALDPTGRWMLVAHQDSNSVAVFEVLPGEGRLRFTGQRVAAGAPVCVRFLEVKP
jgi:6-phosphogluconolactonase